jgi:hypothetical protein
MKELKRYVFVNTHYNGDVVSTLEFSFREVKGEHRIYRRELYENKMRSDTRKPVTFKFFRTCSPEKIEEVIEEHYKLLNMVGYTKVE